jgi:DNA-binding beta-propeller fold protein YncE
VGSQDGPVIVVDVAARRVSASVTVLGGKGGFSLAVSPDGKSVYVSGFGVEGGVRVTMYAELFEPTGHPQPRRTP